MTVMTRYDLNTNEALPGAVRMNLRQFARNRGRVISLRILTEKVSTGLLSFDVSHCHGILPDGTLVDIVGGPLGAVGQYNGLNKVLIDWAKQSGVYAKKLGLLDESVRSTIY